MGLSKHRRLRGSETFLVLRGGGFSVVRAAWSSGKPDYAILGSGAFGITEAALGAQLDAITAALRGSRLRREGVTVVLGDMWSRTQLIAIPDSPREVTHKVLANQVGTSDVFCATAVGSVREGNATLVTHLTMAASERALDALVRALRASSIRVSRFLMLDGALLHYGAGLSSNATAGLHIATIVERGWLHLACYEAKRPVFIRRVETLFDMAADARAAAVVAEIQRTVLVVRGRLKTPELESVVVADPMRLVDRQGVEDGAVSFGVRLEFADVDLGVARETPTAGDVVRAAAAYAVDPDVARTIEVQVDAMKEGPRRLRAAAAVVFMIACIAGTFVFEKHRRRAAEGGATLAPAVDEGTQTLAGIVDDARGMLASFDGHYRGLAMHLANRPPIHGILDRLAPVIPQRFVVESLDVERVDLGGGQVAKAVRVHLRGMARGTLVECRPSICEFQERLARIEGIRGLVEDPVDIGDFGKAPPARGRELTRFAFSFELEIGS